MSRAILWFRNDLRLADNDALIAAVRGHNEVLPVLVIDPRQHGPSPVGMPRSGDRRRAFLWEGVRDLEAALRARGSALQVHAGEPAVVLEGLARKWGASTVHAQELFAHEERSQVQAVAGVLSLQLHTPNTLLHPDDLPFALRDLPHIFTAFRTAVERRLVVRPASAAPALIPTPAGWSAGPPDPVCLPFTPLAPDARTVLPFHGGRAAAEARLTHYFSTAAPAHYKETRNALLGADASSKFSPWLAQGALGPRELYHAIKRYEAAHGANESTYWLVFELLWRDFFQFTAAKHGARIFQRRGIARRDPPHGNDAALFAQWCEGRTGQPFIDANMRELAATGWMSNRGRQNVASFLVHDLGLDWRMGAWWFEHHLLDFDPCSNWGNWQYVAGVGNDPRAGRRFDPVRQAGLYDPDARYTRTWPHGSVPAYSP